MEIYNFEAEIVFVKLMIMAKHFQGLELTAVCETKIRKKTRQFMFMKSADFWGSNFL
jgi:hypothetical protein